MKKTFFTIILSIFVSIISAQQYSENFYYYQGEKISLKHSADKIFLRFAQDANETQISALLSNDTSLRLMPNVNFDDTFLIFAILEEKSGNDISSTTIDFYKSSPEVVSVMPLFRYTNMLLVLKDEFIVKLKNSTSYSNLQKLADKNNCIIGEENQFVKNQFMINVSEKSNLDALQMSNLFYETDFFEFSEPNFIILNAFNSNDTYFTDQWGLKNTGQYGGIIGIDIKAEQAWTITEGSPDIRIAVADVGVDLMHPDLESNILPGYDFIDFGGAPRFADEIHGTACAGIIGAIKDNDIGITGVAPNCKIIPMRIGDWSPNSIDVQITANAINWAIVYGEVDVISNSWGMYPNTPITNAINNAITNGRNGKGCVVVFAVGNSNESTVSYSQ